MNIDCNTIVIIIHVVTNIINRFIHIKINVNDSVTIVFLRTVVWMANTVNIATMMIVVNKAWNTPLTSYMLHYNQQ